MQQIFGVDRFRLSDQPVEFVDKAGHVLAHLAVRFQLLRNAAHDGGLLTLQQVTREDTAGACGIPFLIGIGHFGSKETSEVDGE